MTITTHEMAAFSVSRIALGYIVSFGSTALGVIDFHDHTYTYATPSLNGQWVHVSPVTTSIPGAGDANHGITDLPGGGVFDPWGTAGERGPIRYPVYSQRFMYSGNILPVQIEYEKVMRYLNMTSYLTFSRGILSGGSYSTKTCRAKLLSFNAVAERTLETGSTALTWIEFTGIWRQVGDFIP